MKRFLNIVHVFGSAFAGDWAFYPLQLLKEEGHQVAAVCLGEGPLIGRLHQKGIPAYAVPPPPRLRHLRRGWRCIRALFHLFQQQQAQVAHFHLVPANLYGRIAAWIAHVPVRVTQWPGPMPLETPVGRFLELSTVWMDSAVIASSTATKRIYEHYRHTRGKVRLIYYGFPLEPFDPMIEACNVRQEFHIEDKDQVVALVAYMDPPPKDRRFRGISNKGHEIFIQAARKVKDAKRGVKFLIVGDSLYAHAADEFKKYLREMVHRLELDDTVIFTGYRSDIPDILAATDVVAVPSQSENVGGAVEPLLMEKPVVASNVGGLPDVVIDEETGFLVPPRDPHALAEAILRMLARPPAARRAMGQRGREIVQHLFDLKRTVAQTESLYYQLLDECQDRPV